MKTVKWLVSIGLTFTLFTTMAKGFTIDGTAESAYGSALAVQTLGTSANDSTNGDIAFGSGSELDAAYGVISNNTLYLVIAGNLQANADSSFPWKLEIFIDSIPGQGQNTLANNGALGSGADSGALPRMSAGGDPNNCAGCPGLTFDTGFTADYWVDISYGSGVAPSNNVNFASLPTAGGGFNSFLGRSAPPNTFVSASTGIQAAFNNSNTGGVDTNLCNVNTNGAAQSIAAANVRTGIELAIPLSAIGGASLGSPVNVCAFLNTNNHTYIGNQILGPVTAACVDQDAFGDPLTNNFSTLPGTHYFTVPIALCNYTVGPSNNFYNTIGGSGTLTVDVISTAGGCSWTATSPTPWITITSGGSGAGSGTVNYSVATNTTSSVRVGTIVIANTAPNSTNIVSVAQSGQNLGIITVDGSFESAYGCPISVQQLSTSFGKAPNNPTNILYAGGSELDAAYGLVQNNTLFLLLTGNIQTNGNRIMIFFMTGPGGTNTLVAGQPPIDNVTSSGQTRSVLNWMGPTNNITPFGAGPGLTFDTGFAPTYFMDVNCSPSSVFFSYAQLWPGGTNASGIATNGYFLGSNAGTNGVLLGGTNPYGIQATINNSNTNGVEGGPTGCKCGCESSSNLVGVLESTLAPTATTGIELGIPLAALGSPTGTIAVCAFVANNTGLQLANQILGPFGTNDPSFCMLGPGRTTNTWAPFLVMSSYPGQHYFNVGPEMRIKSIATVATNVVVSYLTENNTNMTYQVQRATILSNNNNTVWTSIGGLSLGNGGIISYTDLGAATNKPARFYRVRQTPLCP